MGDLKSGQIIAIGASLGGTRALESLLNRMPPDTAPIVVVQHTLPGFTEPYVRQLDEECPMRVLEAGDGYPIHRGTVYVAPGGCHLLVERRGDELRTVLATTAAVGFHRPSVDVLFNSLAALSGVDVVAVLLTGMGRDGAEGMLALRRAGAQTIAQDRESSVVFGMAREAIDRGAVQYISSLNNLPDRILFCLGNS